MGHDDANYIHSVSFEWPHCLKPGPLNEAIDAIIEMSDQQANGGLQALNFKGFPEQTEFDEHVLSRLIKRTKNLKTIQISYMNDVNENARKVLINTICEILKGNSGKLMKLNLH